MRLRPKPLGKATWVTVRGALAEGQEGGLGLFGPGSAAGGVLSAGEGAGVGASGAARARSSQPATARITASSGHVGVFSMFPRTPLGATRFHLPSRARK